MNEKLDNKIAVDTHHRRLHFNEFKGRGFALIGHWRHREYGPSRAECHSGQKRKQSQEDRCYQYQLIYEGWAG